ncbi:MAG: CapA family protein [Rubritepida sp.]|nr:CapA family protein [Rubritepida sp.]
MDPPRSPAFPRRRALLGTAAFLPGLAPAPRATLAFLGDVMLGRDISALARQRPPEWFWGEVLAPLRSADAAIANLEGPITTEARQTVRAIKLYHFRADPGTIEILRVARIRAVSLANNHALDFGETGLAETRAHLDEARIVHVGAGTTLAEAAAPAMLDLPGLRVGLLAASDHLFEFAASTVRPGTHVVTIDPEGAALGWIGRSVQALRGRGADLIVLSLHWGPNFRSAPPRRFRAFAQAAIACGVDVLHGHSAHLVHGVERIGRGVVLYDTGNALDDYDRIPFVPQHWGFLFLLDLEYGRPRRLRLLPFENQPLPLRLARGAARAAMLRRMTEACAALGTTARPAPEGLEIALGTPG